MLIRGVYYEDSRPSHVPVKMDRDEFFARVRRDFPHEVEAGVEPLVQTVLQSLRHHITDGEWEDVKSTMPKHLAEALP